MKIKKSILRSKKMWLGVVCILVASGGTTLTVLLTRGDENGSQPQPKEQIAPPTLTSASFELSGTQTTGTINLKSDVMLGAEIELKYFVGTSIPTTTRSL